MHKIICILLSTTSTTAFGQYRMRPLDELLITKTFIHISASFQSNLPLIILFLVGMSIVLLRAYFKIKKQRDVKPPSNSALKGSPIKIKVKLDECEVISHDVVNDDDASSIPSRIDIIDSVYPGNYNEKSGSTASALLYRYKNADGSIKKYYSAVIYTSPDSLRYALLKYTETFIYINPNDPGDYYFDLEFLQR